MLDNYYELLGLDAGATFEEIRKIINAKIREIQGDRYSTDRKRSEEATLKLRQLQQIKKTLLDTGQRNEYDQQVGLENSAASEDRIQIKLTLENLLGEPTSSSVSNAQPML